MFEYKKIKSSIGKYEVYYKDFYLCKVFKKTDKIILSVKGNIKLQNICKKLGVNIEVEQEWNGYGYTIIDKYISKKNIKKVLDIYLDFLNKETEKKNKIVDKNKDKLEKILLAIYTINKEAKRQRDIKYSIADSVYNEGRRRDRLAHYQIANAKDNVDYYYNLKNKGILYLLNNNKYEKLEKHDVNGVDMACLYSNNFCFHFDLNLVSQDMKIIETDTTISGFIESDKKIKGMSLKTAVLLINNL